MVENNELRKVGLKVTLPRVKILQIPDSAAQRHMSAEDVYKALMDAGKPVKFSFRANRAGGAPVEFARGRSASYRGGMSFHPDWKPCYANEIEFAFEPKEER